MRTSTPVFRAAIVLGVGFGAFVDGIVLHQILQWHHLVSEPFPPTELGNLQINTLADGLFHAGAWLVALLGVALLWRAGRSDEVAWSTRALVGGLILGWGLFNLVEGLINHQILGIHHVRPGPNEFAWDMGFLAFAIVLIVAGWLIRRGDKRMAEATT